MVFLRHLIISAFFLLPGCSSGNSVSEEIRFIVISDSHYGEPGTSSRRNLRHIIKWIEFEKRQGLDFFVLNGDISHDSLSYLKEGASFFKKTGVPFFPVRGNHDQVSDSVWKSIWGFPADTTFVLGGVNLIFLSSSDESGNYLCPDNAFLRSAVKSGKRENPSFIFSHIALNQEWARHSVDCPESASILKSRKNIFLFSGHDHDRYGGLKDGGLTVLFSGRSGGSWGEAPRGYRVFEFSKGSWRSFYFVPSSGDTLGIYSSGSAGQ
ncbi:MAG: metallophosphoesterase family protein [Fibrobacterota bacterium]